MRRTSFKKILRHAGFTALLMIAAFILVSCSPASAVRDFLGIPEPQPDYTDDGLVTVAFAHCEGLEITSENPVNIPAGKDAVFSFRLTDGYAINAISDGTVDYDTGTVTVSGVRYSETIRATTAQMEKYRFTLNVLTKEGGKITSNRESGEYFEGTRITVSAEENVNYVFDGFRTKPSEDGTPGKLMAFGNTFDIYLYDDTDVYVSFTKVGAAVRFTGSEGVTLKSEPVCNVLFGQDASFSFTIDEHYTVQSISDNAKIVGDRIVVRNVLNDCEVWIRARQLARYSVTVLPSDSSMGTAAAEGPAAVYEGDEVTLKAAPLSEDYVFVSFTSAKDGGLLYSKEPEYTFVPTSDTTVYANFRKREKYTVTVISSDSTMGSAEVIGLSTVYEGESVTVKASPLGNFAFMSFSTDKNGSQTVSSSPEYTFEPSSDMTLYANFTKTNFRVTLDVSKANGVTLSVPATLSAAEGGTVFFTFETREGTVIDSLSGGGSISGNVITVSNITDDMTLSLVSHVKPSFSFSLATTNATYGKVSSASPDGTYLEGTPITCTAAATEDGEFVGFSIGASSASGGKIISTDTTYSFTLSSNTAVYANFKAAPFDPAKTVSVPEGKWKILYHANGGRNALTNKDDYRTETYSSEYYNCPNTLPNCNYFTRTGYILLGYNTKADGTGTFYGPGWNVIMPEGKRAISLYCVWAKVSPLKDFEYKTYSNNTAAIIKYNGTDSFVVIPETINGYKVTLIKSGFLNANNYVKTLLLSKNITEIETKAITNCARLESIYYYDSVMTSPDSCLQNCGKYKTVYVLACRWPAYPTSRVGTYAIKFERLMTMPSPKLVIVSGSNSAWGVDSPKLEQYLKDAGYEYNVLNYGCSAGTCSTFYLEFISHFVKEGDIVLHQPEAGSALYGSTNLNKTLLDFFEGAYEAYSYVDISQYSGFFSAFATFNTARAAVTVNYSYDDYCTNEPVNKYGDCAWEYTGTTSGNAANFAKWEVNGGELSFSGTATTVKNGAAKINRCFDLIAESGAKVLSSFASVAYPYLVNASKTENGDAQRAYERAVDTYLHTTRISKVNDFIFDRDLFYNTQWHLNVDGKAIRTRRIADDLIAYFSGVGG